MNSNHVGMEIRSQFSRQSNFIQVFPEALQVLCQQYAVQPHLVESRHLVD